MDIKNNRKAVVLPLLLTLAFMLGMFINTLFQNSPKTDRGIFMLPKGNKLDHVLDMVVNDYVDTISKSSLVEKAIPIILKNLDPHTVYIPAKDLQNVNDELKGNFGGIGVQFIRYKDTVAVVRVIEGGPSEKAGMLAGDRIIRVNDSLIAGLKMKDKDIMKRLKGEKGTPVKVGVYRPSMQKNIDIDIIRGSIPMASVNVAYMLNDSIGYIKISRFAATTYSEFMQALSKLKDRSMKNLIVDLRGNTGGYLSEATKMINEFLPKDKMIVYTKGKSQPKTEYMSTGKGEFIDLPIVILMDEYSASASEIFAGAIQDNDRGTIVGRRSFGKGLVQEQRILSDGSALRLTIARYYTPTGRCIQKSYSHGKDEYYNDLNKRYEHGEFSQVDSISFNDTLKFTTPAGKVVYGGGGIMPDIFVPVDTIGYSNYFRKIQKKGLIYKFAFTYVDTHRPLLSELKDVESISAFLNDKNLLIMFTQFAKKEGVKYDAKGLKISKNIISTQIKAYIARDLIDDEGFYPIISKLDNTLKKAKQVF